MNDAIDRLGEEIAYDINQIESSVKEQNQKFQSLQNNFQDQKPMIKEKITMKEKSDGIDMV